MQNEDTSSVTEETGATAPAAADLSGPADVAASRASTSAVAQGTREDDAHAGGEPVFELTFAPQWARKPPDGDYYAEATGVDRDTRRSGRDRGNDSDRDRRGGGGGGPRGRDGDRSRPRPRAREGARWAEGAPRGMPRPGAPVAGRPEAPRRDARPGEARPGGARGGDPRRRDDAPRGERPSNDRPPVFHAAKVEVRFLPEHEPLRHVVRQLAQAKRSVPLMAIAWQFLTRPEACEVQIRPIKKVARFHLYQCQVCRAAATDRELLLDHILRAHLDDFFVKEEKQSEPPAGTFVCVARCGLSGALLGPPNHHSYQQRMQEVRAERYANLSMAEYQSRMQTVRDPEVIEQWKKESCTTTTYRLKDGPPEKTYTWLSALDHVRREIAPQAIRECTHVTMPATVAQRLNDRALLAAVRDAWEQERRYPACLLHALRGAISHMRLYIFRVKGRQQYVSPIAPAHMDTQEVVPEIAQLLGYMSAHPGCTRQQLRAALRPDLTDEQPEAILKFFYPLLWLIERGHVIEFFDGSLAVPVGKPAMTGSKPASAPAPAASNGG